MSTAPAGIFEMREAVGVNAYHPLLEPACLDLPCVHAGFSGDQEADTRESRDVARIVCYARDRMRVTLAPRQLLVLDKSGGWIVHDPRDTETTRILLTAAYDNIKSKGVIAVVRPEDKVDVAEAVVKWTERIDTPHLRNLGHAIAALPHEPESRVKSVTSFDKHHPPALALAMGGAVDIATGMELVPDAYAKLHRRHKDRGAVKHVPELIYRTDIEGLELAVDLLSNHYPSEWLDLAAFHLADPASDLIAVIKGAPGTGKSTFWEWVGWATGSCAVIDTAMLSARAQYTPTEIEMTRNHTVVLDEADASKGKPIKAGQLNLLTAKTFALNPKGKPQLFDVPRLGQLVIVGNDWPDVDTTIPGLDRRIGFAWDLDLPRKLTPDEHKALEANERAHQYLLSVLLIRAATMTKGDARPRLLTEEVVGAKDRFMAERQSPVLTVLSEHIERGQPADYLTSTVIDQLLKNDLDSTPSTTEVGRIMAQEFGAMRTRRPVDGKRVRVWDRVRLRA